MKSSEKIGLCEKCWCVNIQTGRRAWSCGNCNSFLSGYLTRNEYESLYNKPFGLYRKFRWANQLNPEQEVDSMKNSIYLIYCWYDADGPLDHSSDAGYIPIGYAVTEDEAKILCDCKGEDYYYEEIDQINPTPEPKP